MAENMLSVVKYDAGGVEIKLEPETVKNYLVMERTSYLNVMDEKRTGFGV